MLLLQPQAAASLHARSNPNLSYPAKVGVNTYIVIHFPFGRKRKHVTRTVARTFSPEFTYSADLLLPIVLPAGVGGKKQLSLAEQLEDSAIVFEVWLVFRFISLLPEKRFPEKCHFRPTSGPGCRLVPSRYLSVFRDERRLGIRLRCVLGLGPGCSKA